MIGSLDFDFSSSAISQDRKEKAMVCSPEQCLRSEKEGRGLKNALTLSALCLVFSLPACAQNRANVTIDLGKVVNVLTETSLGLPVVTSDENSFSEAGIANLRAAGITSVRYPGNRGVPDLYHWSTNTTSHYSGGDVPYVAPKSNIANLALLAEKLGQAVMVVNYGSNLEGTGGGESAEAAALVAYTNGHAGDTRALGKDSAGKDWRTVGDWASIRGQAPLAVDDGLNFLRIQHPNPFAFKLWQVGDEVYNNGYYGGDHTGNPDLHGAVPSSPKDLGKLKGNAKLSPAAYAANFKQFAQAMKDVDPAILVGAAFAFPPDPDPNNHTWVPDWNKEVLKGACANLDFVTLDWNLQYLLSPDYKTLDEASLLANQGYNQTPLIDQVVSRMLDDYKRSCPAGHVPRLAFAPAAVAAWPKVEHPLVKGLWVADFYAMLIESGSANINWNEMYGDSMLSADRKTAGAVYFGLQMLHAVIHSPGDALVDTRSSTKLVAAHASHRRDGFVGLMLINKDPQNAATVTVTFKNGTLGSTGKRIDCVSGPSGAGAKLAVSPFSAPSEEFTVTVPAYAITDILQPDHK